MLLPLPSTKLESSSRTYNPSTSTPVRTVFLDIYVSVIHVLSVSPQDERSPVTGIDETVSGPCTKSQW